MGTTAGQLQLVRLAYCTNANRDAHLKP